MMGRILHLVAIAALVGSALYAYRIKYDTIYYAEQVAKLKHKLQREKDAIAVLRAEWSFLSRPERVQALADRHTDLVPLQITQLARWSEVPDRRPPVDAIGRKLESLGLAEPTTTPAPARRDEARTPTPRKP